MQAFTLSRSSSKPLWEQVREVIHGEIESGVYAAGDRLPTETEYAQRFSVSLNPVRAALHELVRAGIIERINGRGTFVLGQMVTSQIELLSSTSQSLRRQGLSFRTRLLELGAQDAEDASEYVRAELRVGRRGKLWRLDRLVEIEGKPSILMSTWLRMPRIRGFDRESRFAEGGSLYEYLSEQGIVLGSGHARLEIDYADDSQSELLRVPFGWPLLLLSSVAHDDSGEPIEVSLIRYNSRTVALTFDRQISGA